MTPAEHFAAAILDLSTADSYDLDGNAVQQAALKAGLLVPKEMAGPCGDTCLCAELIGEWPTTCNVLTEAGKALMAARKASAHG